MSSREHAELTFLYARLTEYRETVYPDGSDV